MKITTLRLSNADVTILQKLAALTGLKHAQIIRLALRSLLKRLESGR